MTNPGQTLSLFGDDPTPAPAASSTLRPSSFARPIAKAEPTPAFAKTPPARPKPSQRDTRFAPDSVGGPLFIDGNNLVRAVYEAQPTEDSPEKVATGMRNAMASFRRALKDHSPSHAAVVFDPSNSRNWRHELYPAYNAKRKPMYSGLRAALPELQVNLRRQLGLTSIIVEGHEADDVLGTLVARWGEYAARAPGTVGRAIVMTTDKDLCQLLALGARVYNHFKREWRDAEWVVNRFGVTPDLLGDLLALAGDTTDGVPGLPGVGEKTAAKLLNEHGSLAAILTSTTLKGKVAESILLGGELVQTFRELVSLKTDVPLGMTWSMLQLR